MMTSSEVYFHEKQIGNIKEPGDSRPLSNKWFDAFYVCCVHRDTMATTRRVIMVAANDLASKWRLGFKRLGIHSMTRSVGG